MVVPMMFESDFDRGGSNSGGVELVLEVLGQGQVDRCFELNRRPAGLFVIEADQALRRLGLPAPPA